MIIIRSKIILLKISLEITKDINDFLDDENLKHYQSLTELERLPSQAHASEPVRPKPYIKTACDLFTDSIHSP